jgi:y4mF family transcriptional regulator
MRIYDTRSLGILVRDRRATLGWSQQQLGERIGVSRFWVMHLERGKPTLELALVLRAVQALGLRLAISPAHPAVEDMKGVSVAGGDHPGPARVAIDLATIVGAQPTRRSSLRPAHPISPAPGRKSGEP